MTTVFAFPLPQTLDKDGMLVTPGDFGEGGMELRDYFAAAVIAGWGEGFHSIAWELKQRTPDAGTIAVAAYSIANAMMEARKG